jgi:arylsulfatase A-like enzyme
MDSSDSANTEASRSHPGRKTRRRILISVAAVTVIIGAIVAGLAWRDSQQQSELQLWPAGTPQGIEELANRDDLNVLFILVDTLRADRMSAYGYERDTTPILENLSRAGIRFQHNLSQSSWTKASMASMWTSFYPTRTAILEYDDVIPDAALMPAEVFAREGFRTIGLYRNGWVAPVFGFGQGFDIYKKPSMSRRVRPDAATNPTASDRGNDEEVVRAAREFLRIEGDADQRWFLYLHLMDVHEYTYDEASALFGSSYSDIYDASIRWTDTTLDILLGTMLDWGLLKKTIVVIASDHGEAFREHGHEGHARFVYRETTETPFIILLPFRLEQGGVVVHSRSRNVDIFPTLYEMLGIEIPQELEEADGVSLMPDILAAARGDLSYTSVAREGFSHLRQGWGQRTNTNERASYSLTSGKLRYLSQNKGPEVIEELFDARSDPKELKDVSLERSDEFEAMRTRAKELAEIDAVWGEPETRELSELELNQLRALGYEIE